MLRYVGRRLIATLPVLFVATLIVFGLILLVPGDPAVTLAGENASLEQIAELRQSMGLDRPIIARYLDWLGSALRGDLGTSLYSNQSVVSIVGSRLPVTLSLTGMAVVYALIVGVVLATISALRRGRLIDRATMALTSLGLAVPNYWLALMLVAVLAIGQAWFPSSLYVQLAESPGGWLHHLILPAIALGTVAASEFTRQLRGSLVGVLEQDYVRTAYAKGLPRWLVVGKHAMKNSLASGITVLGFHVVLMLGGSVIVEQIFALPGLGSLAFRAVVERNIPVIQGVVIVAVLATVLVNLLVDIAYAVLNPKVRAA